MLPHMSGRQKDLAATLFLLAFCALFFLPSLDVPPVSRQKELRVLVPARNMAHGGNWMIPDYLGTPRLRKPPLLYWVEAALFTLTGRTDSAYVARLPAAAFSTGLLLLIYWGGRRLVGRRRALLGATVAATSFLFIRHAGLAETDVPLTLAMAAATLTAFRIAAGRGRADLGTWACFGLLSGLAFMIKGMSAVLPLVTLVVFGLATPAARGSAFRLKGWLVALALFALVSSPWYLYIHLGPYRDITRTAIQSELKEALVVDDHPGTPDYYLRTLPVACLPWGLLLPLAAALLAWRGRGHAGTRFLLTWFAVSFLIMSFVKNKQFHYNVHLLPQAALVAGWLWGRMPSARPAWLARLLAGFSHAGFILLAATAAAVTAWAAAYPPMRPALWPGVVLTVAIVGAGLATARRGHLARLLVSSVLILAAVQIYMFCLYPLNSNFVIRDFGKAIRPHTDRSERILALAAPSITASLEFYLDRPIRVLNTAADLAGAGEHDVLIVCGNKKRALPYLPALGEPVVSLVQEDVDPPGIKMRRDRVECRLYLPPFRGK